MFSLKKNSVDVVSFSFRVNCGVEVLSEARCKIVLTVVIRPRLVTFYICIYNWYEVHMKETPTGILRNALLVNEVSTKRANVSEANWNEIGSRRDI